MSWKDYSRHRDDLLAIYNAEKKEIQGKADYDKKLIILSKQLELAKENLSAEFKATNPNKPLSW